MSERGEVFAFAFMDPVLIFNCDDRFSFATFLRAYKLTELVIKGIAVSVKINICGFVHNPETFCHRGVTKPENFHILYVGIREL